MVVSPSPKHSGVIPYFSKRFIKTGEFPREIGRALNKAFDLRQRGDYREQVELTYEQVEPFLKSAREVIELVTEYLRGRGGI